MCSMVKKNHSSDVNNQSLEQTYKKGKLEKFKMEAYRVQECIQW